MHALVVRVTIHDPESADSFLKEQIVPAVSSAPGFITGHWVRFDEGHGTSLAVFESEEAATAAREKQAVSRPRQIVTVDSIDVGEVVANA